MVNISISNHTDGTKITMANDIIEAFPAKRFFVEMLTRDIELQDAILDLLDNCLDGALRSISSSNEEINEENKYHGFYSKINFNEDGFTIEDNCGGISGSLATSYAFRMGRPNERDIDNIPTIGVYGIGMKRAIFKLGTSSQVLSKTKDEEFKVTISPEWLSNDKNWKLDLERGNVDLKTTGVKIIVNDLRDDVKNHFKVDRDFQQKLINSVSNHYSLILNKGFKVYINDIEVKPNLTSLIIDTEALVSAKKGGITPYFYRGETNGVSIKIAVGFYRDFVTEDEENSFLTGRNTSEKAGWTIICNDRVVVHADKTRLTGWGEAGVPQYHTQFVGIAGVAIFTSNEAEKLPITTTKRGIDGNSDIYLATKDFMREGLKIFTDFTNRWKSNSPERQQMFSSTSKTIPLTNDKLDSIVPEDKWSRVHRSIGGNSFKPTLPIPKETDPLKQIKFSRRLSEIKTVATFIFDDDSVPPTEIGNYCFEDFLERAKK
mgnify:CR=1 FL=1